MSGLAGVWNLDGAPADRAALERMTTAIAHRGPDGIHHVVDGSIAIGHCMLCTTPESLHETQPLWDETGNYCLAMDGRVDNREDLARDLKTAGFVLRDDTDAELVLKSYIAWREAAPHRILGDFAFVVWDKLNRRLFCARDPLGVKPFYYFTDGKVFLWASELQQLFQHPAVGKQPNEGMVAEYLADQITSLEETLYAGIMLVPPASVLTVSSNSRRIFRYWDIDPSRQLRYQDDREYADHCLEILQEAVRCRLRSNGPVAAELSGGVDSSSIVGIWHVLRGKMKQRVPEVRSYSLAYPGKAGEMDYVADCVRAWRIHNQAVTPASADVDYSWYVNRYADFPDFPSGAAAESLRRAESESACRVALTGFGGDEWFTGTIPNSPLRRFRSTLGGIYRRIFCTGRLLGESGVPSWVPREFAVRTNLADRIRVQTPRSCQTPSLRQLYHMLHFGFRGLTLVLQDRCSARFSLDHRHPFFDRRIVEFAFQLPAAQLWSSGYTKRILRRAVSLHLPATILHRKDKGAVPHLSAEVLFGRYAQRLERPLISEERWVSCGRVREMYKVARRRHADDSAEIPFTWPLSMILGIDLWFGGVFEKKCTDVRAETQLI